MAFTGPAEDRQRIRERFEIYSDAVARQDLQTYLACWADGGRRTGAGGECAGKDELRAHWHGVFETIEQMAFFTQLAALEVDSDRAMARSYCLEIMRGRDGATRRLVGEYDDDLVRVNSDWLFTRRDYRVALTF